MPHPRFFRDLVDAKNVQAVPTVHVAVLWLPHTETQGFFILVPLTFLQFPQQRIEAMNIFKWIGKENGALNCKTIRYEDFPNSFDEVFRDVCKFLEIKEFCPKPVLPNSSFKKFDKVEDFNSRWKSWPETKKACFKKNDRPPTHWMGICWIKLMVATNLITCPQSPV